MSIQIVAVGEVLWDLLPSGAKLGGAPTNFGYHAHALGARSTIVSRVGDDALGEEILERFRRLGLDGRHVTTDPKWPTGTVSVEVSGDGQPKFMINADVAWDHIPATKAALAAAGACDVICFGSLAQRCERSRGSIRRLVRASRVDALRVFDINLRPPFISQPIIEDSLKLANVLKLNDQEFPALAEMLNLKGDAREQLAALARRFELRLIAMTRGSAGSLLYANGVFSDHGGVRVQVRDAVGAGDAFTAAMMLGYLKGWPIDRINDHANRVAAYVCTQEGATPEMPAELAVLH